MVIRHFGDQGAAVVRRDQRKRSALRHRPKHTHRHRPRHSTSLHLTVTSPSPSAVTTRGGGGGGDFLLIESEGGGGVDDDFLKFSLRNDRNWTDSLRSGNQAYSSVLVAFMAAIFVFITVATTVSLAAFCRKRNAVFALQKSQQEDLEDCEMEEFHTEVEETQSDIFEELDSRQPQQQQQQPHRSCSSNRLSSRDRMYRAAADSWADFLQRSASNFRLAMTSKDGTQVGLRNCKSETLRCTSYQLIQHSASN